MSDRCPLDYLFLYVIWCRCFVSYFVLFGVIRGLILSVGEEKELIFLLAIIRGFCSEGFPLPLDA